MRGPGSNAAIRNEFPSALLFALVHARINLSQPFTEPLRNHCVSHYVRVKLLRGKALPPLCGCRAALSCRGTTLNAPVFDSVVRYGGTIAWMNAKPVARQHPKPAALHSYDAILLPTTR